MRSAFLFLLVVSTVAGIAIPIRLAQVPAGPSTPSPPPPTTPKGPVLEHPEVLYFMHNVWVTTVIVGTPGTKFNVTIDTTSSFLWIPDKTCTTEGCIGKHMYDATASSTYQSTFNTFKVTTMFGAVDGILGIDTVTLGENFNGPTSVVVPYASFGTATTVGNALPAGVDGVLGLAFPGLAPKGAQPVFTTAMNNGDVFAGIFVLWLEDQYATSDNGTEGVIYYGDVDYLHCLVDQRHIYPLSGNKQFQFTIPAVTVGNYQYKSRAQTIIDSTSRYIAAPGAFVANVLYMLGLPSNTLLPAMVPCDLKIEIDFQFPLGTESVDQLNLIYKEADGTCRLALVESPLDQNGGNQQLFELGIPFLRGRCTYFDLGNHQIGFSQPITHGGHDGSK